ncbi:hypothetical protein GCM10010522_04440 [Kribbella solani]
MTNPPAGWYPDPTGQPHTIRWWNGEKWTNKTDHESALTNPPEANPGSTSPAGVSAATPSAPADSASPSAPSAPVSPDLRPVDPNSTPNEQGGWWQQPPSPDLWDTATDTPRLRAVTPDDASQSAPAPQPPEATEPAPPTAAARAQATWGAPELAPAPPEHWTQREPTEEDLAYEDPDPITPEPEPTPARTLRLAPAPTQPETGTTADSTTDATTAAEADSTDVTAATNNGAAVDPSATGSATAAGSTTAGSTAGASTPTADASAGTPNADDVDVDGDADGWANVSWTEEPRFAPVPREDAQPEDDDLELSAQPDWGSQSDDQQDDQPHEDLATDEPAWGVEARDDHNPQTPEQDQGPLWTMPSQDDATQEQPVWNPQASNNNQPPEQYQLWGESPQQPDNQQPDQGQAWGTGQQPAQEQQWGYEQQPTDQNQPWPEQDQAQGWGDQQDGQQNGWGVSQQAAPDADPWGQQNGQPVAEQTWGGQSWPLQQSDTQQTSNSSQPAQHTPQQSWTAVEENGQQAWAGSQGNGGQGNAPQQAWGDVPQRAWGDEDESWGGQADLSSGVGKRDKDKKKPKGPGGGGPLSGKLPLVIAGGLALVMLIAAAIYLITSGNDKTADPTPTGTPTQASPTPTNQSSTKPGQSKNPKLHEGDGRISSDAISFPRRTPPWSDHKLFVRQVLDSSGQRIVLQRDVNGTDDWTADIFVGALGTGSGFNGDPKATAAALAIQLRTNMYGNIPATYQTVANGAVKKSGKSGWFFKQSVTATSAAVTDRVLTLTVAVFDLGDGTAVAYVSGIPTNRPDLRTAETQAYQGINVG